MKTRTNQPAFAVITNDENKVVAIISCKPGSDLSSQIQEAIKEDEACESVSLTNPNLELDAFDIVTFDATIVDDSGDVFEKSYDIVIAPVY